MKKLAENDASDPSMPMPPSLRAMWPAKSPAGARSSGRSISRPRSEVTRFDRSSLGAASDYADPFGVIARRDRAIQCARSVFTGSPGRAGR